MPPLEAFAAAGGWVVCVGVLYLLVRAFITGSAVAGATYQREVMRADRLGDQADQSTKALAQSTAAVLRLERRLQQMEATLARGGMRLPEPDDVPLG